MQEGGARACRREGLVQAGSDVLTVGFDHMKLIGSEGRVASFPSF